MKDFEGDPKVSVLIVTYNHERFIAEAVRSAANQVVNFPYEIVIADDSSTDNTFQICCGLKIEYPGLIKLVEPSINLGLVRNYSRAFNNCTGKYIAILEGDDYWTDTNKLQCQFDLMESNEQIGLTHTRTKTLFENGEIKINYHLRANELSKQVLFEKLLTGEYTIVPLSVMFRRSIFDRYVDFDFCVRNDLRTIDAFIWPEFAMHGEIVFVDRLTGVYRYLSNSVSNSKDYIKVQKFIDTKRKITDYYISKYEISISSRERIDDKITRKYLTNALKNNKLHDARIYAEKLPKNSKTRFLRICTMFPSLFKVVIINERVVLWLSKVKQFVLKQLKKK